MYLLLIAEYAEHFITKWKSSSTLFYKVCIYVVHNLLY